MLLHVDVRSHDGHTVVAVDGEIDASTADLVRTPVAEALEAGEPTVLLDLAAVTFIDSTGLSVLVTSHCAAETRGATFAVVHPSRHTRKLIRVLGLDQLLHVFDSHEQALARRR